MAEVLTLYKLIILYMLNKVNFPLTNSQISEFILEREYTNYFTVQTALAEAIDSGLIRTENTYQRTIYHLTTEGAETIQFFHEDISPVIRKEIDTYLTKNRYDLKNDTDITADFYPNNNDEFSVHLLIKEGKSNLIDLTLSVPTESIAETIANNWTQKNQEVYALIMEHLL